MCLQACFLAEFRFLDLFDHIPWDVVFLWLSRMSFVIVQHSNIHYSHYFAASLSLRCYLAVLSYKISLAFCPRAHEKAF